MSGVPDQLLNKAIQVAKDILSHEEVMSLGVVADDGNPHVVAVGYEYENGVLRWQARGYSRHGKYAQVRSTISFLIVGAAEDSSISGQVQAKLDSRDEEFISFSGTVEELFVRLPSEYHQEYTDAVRLTPDDL